MSSNGSPSGLARSWPSNRIVANTTAVLLTARFGVLALCVLLTLLQESPDADRTALLLLLGLALVASIPVPSRSVARLWPVAEMIAAAAIIVLGPVVSLSLLPYLVVPALAAGFSTGAFGAAVTTVSGFVTLVGIGLLARTEMSRTDVLTTAQWLGLALATGLIGAWARAVATRPGPGIGTYQSAHRLLTRLRDVARALPTGLDEVALAQQVLTSMAEQLQVDRAALYTVTDAGVTMPLAFHGATRLAWVPKLDSGIWADVWRSGSPLQQHSMFSEGRSGSGVVLALRLGDRRVGLVGIERESGSWSRREIARAQDLADESALRIDTGQLFSEIRALATVEERRRLAREIHDGIAQEIASLGYQVDDLRARSTDLMVREDLAGLRANLSQLVTELRLSIFDLRSDIAPSTGLGAALSSYVRSVGTSSGLTVHLVLDESSQRLRLDVETELLRIAQEAVTNARKHSRAKNLWVTCRVDPPRAFLRVADDGSGLGSPRRDSFGLEIMRERALRLGATITVRNRVGGGAVVEVTLGPQAYGAYPPHPLPIPFAPRQLTLDGAPATDMTPIAQGGS